MRGSFTLNGELGSVQRESFTVNCVRRGFKLWSHGQVVF